MNFRQLIEVRSLLSVVRCQLKKIRVNSRDTWKLICDFANFARKNILVIREIRGEIPDSSFELLSFFNSKICEFVGDCEVAVKDAIY